MEGGVNVVAGSPRLYAETSLGVPLDEGLLRRRQEFSATVRVQGYYKSLIVGASRLDTGRDESLGRFATGRAVFNGVDARWTAGGVQVRSEWIFGQPFEGVTTRGGYIDAIVHRAGMGPVTAVARVERLDYTANTAARSCTSIGSPPGVRSASGRAERNGQRHPPAIGPCGRSHDRARRRPHVHGPPLTREQPAAAPRPPRPRAPRPATRVPAPHLHPLAPPSRGARAGRRRADCQRVADRGALCRQPRGRDLPAAAVRRRSAGGEGRVRSPGREPRPVRRGADAPHRRAAGLSRPHGSGLGDRRGCRHDFRDGRRVSRQARGRLLPRHRRPGPADRRSTRAGEDGRAADHRGDDHGARRPLGVRHRPLRTEPVPDRVRAGHVRRRSARHDHGGLQARRRGRVGAGARDELRGEPGVRGQSAVRQQPRAGLARGPDRRC